MIEYDLSTLVDFPAALTEFAEDFAADYNIDDVRGFIARASARIGTDLDAAIYASVQVVDGELMLQILPHRRTLGHFVQTHQDMIREGAA